MSAFGRTSEACEATHFSPFQRLVVQSILLACAQATLLGFWSDPVVVFVEHDGRREGESRLNVISLEIFRSQFAIPKKISSV